MKRRILTEDEIKQFAKNECILITGAIKLGGSMSEHPEQWHYEENRNDSFKNIKINKID